MGEGSHLYSVDSQGEATSPPPPSDPTDGTSRRRAPAAARRPRYPVPTDRMKFDTQVAALRALCTGSRGGQDPVDADKLSTLLSVSAATAGLNNNFFVSVHLAEKRGRGSYLPTKMALDFHNKWSFNRKEAPLLLAPAFADSWFLDAVKQRVEMGADVTVESMIETLAGEAQTDSTYATQYGFLLDWLEYAGLITTEGGIVRLVGTDGAVPPPDPGGAASTATPEQKVVVTPITPEVQEPIVSQRGPAVIDLKVALYATADDLAKLNGEQITALFEGIGKVASVKAILAQG